MKGLLDAMLYRLRQGRGCSGISLTERTALFAGLMLVLILPPSSFGQGLTGSISGIVTDPNGAPISGATVNIRRADTNAIRTITTSDVGSYTVTQLTPGLYSLRIEKLGFNVFQRENVVLAIDQVAQIDASLNVGSETQTINVTSEAPVLQTESSSIGLVVDRPTIQNTPLNGHLSILDLLNLVPGVQDVAAQDQVPVRGVTLAFGTNQRNSYGDVGFTFDGVCNMEAMLQRGEGEVPPLDTLSKFKVITSGAPAEFNQPNQVIIVSQGGANQLHGEALEFNRSKGTSAKQYFGGSQPRPPYQRNEYGGNLSGPIYIPKIYNGMGRSFFAFGYEGFHLTQSVSLTSQQPTVLMRQGNFSEFTTPIFNPFTGEPFPGNIIPESMFNSVDVDLQNLLYPLPTAAGTGVNTFELVPHTTNVNRYFFRIDHKIDDNNQLRFSFLRALYGPFSDVASQGSGSSKAGGVARDGEHNTIFVLGWTHAFSPTMLLDSYVSYAPAAFP